MVNSSEKVVGRSPNGPQPPPHLAAASVLSRAAFVARPQVLLPQVREERVLAARRQ